ncbi:MULTISPECIES: hypothetical protein [unclassified Pseudoalteromonas]|uniref:hypothetical protein n=1 Tax=unclassified Pseudoalteromonas TaxID=194690 RepID=UPI002098124B|nr:hypothetical protein [Pseudoalteromonas sp. XMcav2-N]MCO7189008.1 hypothetical protein [Pseudoalteromonas sp. XMcav2-N]
MKVIPFTQQSATGNAAHPKHSLIQFDQQRQFTQQLYNAMNSAGRTQSSDVTISTDIDPANISGQARTFHQIAKGNAQKYVDLSLPEKQQHIQLYQETMREIMEMPIQVSVEPHEVNEALLFNNLGIDFMAYKELKVRIEMLDLTEQEINADKSLPSYEKDKLKDNIDERKARLEMAIDDLLGDTQDPQLTPESAKTPDNLFSLS